MKTHFLSIGSVLQTYISLYTSTLIEKQRPTFLDGSKYRLETLIEREYDFVKTFTKILKLKSHQIFLYKEEALIFPYYISPYDV